MQPYNLNDQDDSPPVINFSKRNYTRFLFFMGMTVFSVLLLVVMQAIDQRYNNNAVEIADSETEVEAQNEAITSRLPAPVIVNIPQQQSQPETDSSLGLNLEEYSNLSDPTDEMINCLKFEGGKGCFKDDYQPTQPPQYYQYYSANNSQAVRVITGQALPYWQPSSLPPVKGCLGREYLVRWQGKTYCGRRLIQKH